MSPGRSVSLGLALRMHPSRPAGRRDRPSSRRRVVSEPPPPATAPRGWLRAGVSSSPIRVARQSVARCCGAGWTRSARLGRAARPGIGPAGLPGEWPGPGRAVPDPTASCGSDWLSLAPLGAALTLLGPAICQAGARPSRARGARALPSPCRADKSEYTGCSKPWQVPNYADALDRACSPHPAKTVPAPFLRGGGRG